MRPPHVGWFLVLAMAASVLLAAKSGIDDRRALRRIHRADAIIDSLTRGRWVRLDSGDVLIRRKAGR